MFAEIAFCAGLLALVAASTRVRAPTAGVAAASLAALVIRLFWTTPAFVHDGFHGPLILNGVLGFPSPLGHGTYGEGYGPGSFVVLGLLSFLTGRSAEGVLAANAIVSSLATFPLAAAAAGLSARPRAGLHAAILWAGSPLVARLAHSEDAHIVGLALALAGIAFAVRAQLLPAVLATALAMWSRQSFIIFAPIVALLFIERRVARRGLGCAALGICLIVRAASTAASSDGRELTIGLSLVPANLGWIPGFLKSHPLFSIPRLPPVVLLVVAGAVALRKSPARYTLLFAWLTLFALSLASSFPSVGVRWSFRLPVYALSLLVAGAGAAWLEERLGRIILLATLLLAAAGTATLENRAPNAEFVEYTWLRDHLPRDRGLIGYREPGPAWRLPALLAGRSGVPVARLPGNVMLDGIGCYVWDVPELAGAQRGAAHQLPERAEVERVMALMLDARLEFGKAAVPAPVGARPDCAEILAHAVPFGPPGPEVTLEDSPPTAVFSKHRIQLRLVEWRP